MWSGHSEGAEDIRQRAMQERAAAQIECGSRHSSMMRKSALLGRSRSIVGRSSWAGSRAGSIPKPAVASVQVWGMPKIPVVQADCRHLLWIPLLYAPFSG